MRIHSQTLARVGAAFLASTLLVTGCADSSDDEASNSGGDSSLTKEEIYAFGIHGKQDEGTPKKGGQLTVGEYAEARSLDPTVTYPYGSVGASALAAVYDVLVRYDYETASYVPQLAESLESNEDYTEWTLKLRKGTKFSDGTPLNAKAVLGSQKYYTDNFGFNTAMLLANVASAEATDDLTVVYKLRKPWAQFAGQLASGYGMITAPAAYKGGKDKFKPIGAGPFIEESYKPTEERILVRNDDYVGDPAYLDSIRFTFPASDRARLEALKNGDYDQVAVRYANTVEEARKDGIGGVMMPIGLGQMYWINAREGRAGHDVRIRRAMAMAIDPEQFLQRTADGAGIPSRNIYSPSAEYYTEIDELETDLEEAKKLVAEAKADGVPTTIKVLSQSDQSSKTAAVTVEAMLKSIGLEVEIEYLASVTDQLTRLYGTFDFDISPSSLSLPTEDAFVGLANGLLEGATTNASGYSSPEMTKLIEELQASTGDERTEVAKKINELWQQDMPGIPLAPGAHYTAWNEGVNGIIPTGGDSMMLYNKAWLS